MMLSARLLRYSALWPQLGSELEYPIVEGFELLLSSLN